uniref:glutathione transferase n=1 Tax=Mycena chlorophos TaxID=658473 RepID=A0ABQ0LVE2_MYCCL|nr:glutathione S-transferase [Mycena chlorophos]
MVLKLFTHGRVAGGTGFVALVLAEKRIPFTQILVNIGRQENKTPEHLERQPFAQVPAMDDDGFVLYESRAICRYLAEKYPEHGPRLLPGPSLQERMLFEQAASVEFADFHLYAVRLAGATLSKVMRAQPIDKTAVDSILGDFGVKLDAYEKILSKNRYMTGEEISLVDFFHLGIMPGIISLTNNQINPMTSPSRPNVARWWTELTSRPAWVKLQRDGIQSQA